MGKGVKVEFSSDELILALMSLIRASNPAMLRQGPEGITVDFDSLEGKSALNDDEQLLLKFQAALSGPAAQDAYALELTAAESNRLAQTLEHLESLQPWPADVLEISRELRARICTV